MKYGLEAFSVLPPNPPPGVSAANEELFGCAKPFYDDVFSPWQATGVEEQDKSLFDLLCSQSVRADSSDDSSSTTDFWGPSSPFGTGSVDDFLNEGDLIAFLRDSYKSLRDPQDDPWFLSNCANMDDVCSLGRTSTGNTVEAFTNTVSENPSIALGNHPNATETSSASALPTFSISEVVHSPPGSNINPVGSEILSQASIPKQGQLSFSQATQPVFPICISNPAKASQFLNQPARPDSQWKVPSFKSAPLSSPYPEPKRRSPPPVLAKTEFPNVSLTTANTRQENVSDVCQRFSDMRKQGLRQLYFDRVRTIKDTNSASKSKRISLLLSSSSDDPIDERFLSDPVDVADPPPKVDIEAANDDHSYSTSSSPIGDDVDLDDNGMETDDDSTDSSDDEHVSEDPTLAGKGRKSEAEDWTANPRKLIRIGEQIEKITSLLNTMKPPPQHRDDDCSARDRMRREKNKLASRACRLKKKAGLEANKIKLRGLTMEQNRLKHYLLRGKSVLVFPGKEQINGNQLMAKIRMTLNDQVAGNLSAFVDTVIARSLEAKNSDFRFRSEWLS